MQIAIRWREANFTYSEEKLSLYLVVMSYIAILLVQQLTLRTLFLRYQRQKQNYLKGNELKTSLTAFFST